MTGGRGRGGRGGPHRHRKQEGSPLPLGSGRPRPSVTTLPSIAPAPETTDSTAVSPAPRPLPQVPLAACVVVPTRGGSESRMLILQVQAWSPGTLKPWQRSPCPLAQRGPRKEGSGSESRDKHLRGMHTSWAPRRPRPQLLPCTPAATTAPACSQPPGGPRKPPVHITQPSLTPSWPHLPMRPPDAQGWGGQGGQNRPRLAE